MIIVSFKVYFMSFLTLIVISCINSYMFSFIMSFTSTVMDFLISLIITDICSFQLTDLSESESKFMSSWVSRVAIHFSFLFWIVEYFENGVDPLPEPCPPRPPLYLA